MGKGKVIGSVAAAILVPSAVVAAAVLILPKLGITASKTLYYFGNGTDISESGTISLSEEEVLSYESRYANAMTNFYKSELNESETYIYNAAMFAAENGYSDIFLPDTLLDDSISDKVGTIEYVVTFLSCDSPFIAHNYTTDNKLTVSEGEFVGKTYYHLQFETFGDEYKSRRDAAYEKAKSVIASIPDECDTEEEKARYLYNYVAVNTSYQAEDYSTRNVPVADLLIDGKAICDGYADTITMLFNMAGIETTSANGTETESRNGHTINLAKLDGDYYYFDASNDSILCGQGFTPAFYFGMSWDEASVDFAFADRFSDKCPKSKKSMMADNIDIEINDISADTADKAAELFGEKTTIIVRYASQIGEEECRSFMSVLATAVGHQLSSVRTNGLVGIKIYEG